MFALGRAVIVVGIPPGGHWKVASINQEADINSGWVQTLWPQKWNLGGQSSGIRNCRSLLNIGIAGEESPENVVPKNSATFLCH